MGQSAMGLPAAGRAHARDERRRGRVPEGRARVPRGAPRGVSVHARAPDGHPVGGGAGANG